MLFEENIILALEDLLPDVLFVFAYRNHAEPQDPYCLVEQISIFPTAHAERNTSVRSGDKIVETISTPTNCIFNLSFYSQSNSKLQEISRRFQMGLESSRFAFAFASQKLSVVSLTKLMFTSESVNNTTQIKRGTIQLTVSGIVNEEWEVDAIDNVKVIGIDKENRETFFDKNYDTKEKKWLVK